MYLSSLVGQGPFGGDRGLGSRQHLPIFVGDGNTGMVWFEWGLLVVVAVVAGVAVVVAVVAGVAVAEVVVAVVVVVVVDCLVLRPG